MATTKEKPVAEKSAPIVVAEDAPKPLSAAALEQVVVHNDLAKLAPADRLNYYSKLCEALGLNPLTRPFQYIVLNGKLSLYASKDCTEQLRKTNSVSLQIVARELVGDIYIVTARAVDHTGRCDESTGAVSIAGLKGEALANAYMKAETKAKRRVTLSLCGLGILDESEKGSVANGFDAEVDFETGEVISVPQAQPAATEKPEPAMPIKEWALSLNPRLSKEDGVILKAQAERLSLTVDELLKKARSNNCTTAEDVMQYVTSVGAVPVAKAEEPPAAATPTPDDDPLVAAAKEHNDWFKSQGGTPAQWMRLKRENHPSKPALSQWELIKEAREAGCTGAAEVLLYVEEDILPSDAPTSKPKAEPKAEAVEGEIVGEPSLEDRIAKAIEGSKLAVSDIIEAAKMMDIPLTDEDAVIEFAKGEAASAR